MKQNSMNSTTALLLSACLATLIPVAGFADPGSIPVAHETPQTKLPAMAKIPMIAAINAALAVAPGKVIEAKLLVESGSLQYNVIIVGADNTLFDADVDAGNGKVLVLEKNGEEVELDAISPAKK